MIAKIIYIHKSCSISDKKHIFVDYQKLYHLRLFHLQKKKGFEFHLRKMVGVQYFLKTILEGLQTKLLVEDSGGQLQRPGTREMELLGIMKNLFEIRKHEFKKGLGSTILRNLVCVYVRVCVCARGSVSVCFSIIFNCIENQDGIEIALYFTRGV